jgi:hypothetical protein
MTEFMTTKKPRMKKAAVWRFHVSLVLSCLWLLTSIPVRAEPSQFILFNLAQDTSSPKFIGEVRRQFANSRHARVRVGVSRIFSYLSQPREEVVRDLKSFLTTAQATDTPVVIQLDGENWWQGRPDLWNWWEPNERGYAPANRSNVEWTGWSSEKAIKIAWRNWGNQLRITPPPNLMSPAYRAACHEEMRVVVPMVVHWWKTEDSRPASSFKQPSTAAEGRAFAFQEAADCSSILTVTSRPHSSIHWYMWSDPFAQVGSGVRSLKHHGKELI